MSTQIKLQQGPTIPLSPDEQQNQASNPHENIWVSASAGSGKTKVLTDRVLRLLLPRSDGLPATKPHKILCLTFTKAAANEMELRLKKTLGKWAIMPDKSDDKKNSLYHTLEKLLGHAPTELQIQAAQRLFSEVIDSASGLQIITIHSFCQSVLSRFPLEAGISPNFTALEEDQSALLLDQALKSVLADAQKTNSSLFAPLKNLSRFINEDQFRQLVKSIISEKYQLKTILGKNWNHNTLYTKLCSVYEINSSRTSDDLIARTCSALTEDQEQELKIAAHALLNGSGASEPLYGKTILEWLNGPPEDRIYLYEAYCKVFISSGENVRSRGFPTKDTEKDNPGCTDVLQAEGQRLLDAQMHLRKIFSAEGTRDLIHIGAHIIEEYDRLKSKSGALDFDDLIIKTLELMEGGNNFSSWMMYKLDQGLDHILVDEAQDTNPEQWKIIEALCHEFFAGQSARDNTERTSFVVGDLKQSIYSFQRAAPSEFIRMRQLLQEKIDQAGKPFRRIPIDISFRSTESILNVVNAVFDAPDIGQALGDEEIKHSAFRQGQAGLVELWPLFKTQKKEAKPYWEPPIEIKEYENSAAQLSAYIADKIASWLENKETLPAYDRPVEAGDIIILVRTRTKLVDQLVRALKFRDIPVNGIDRLILGEHIAVQDMRALGNFALLPDDDLTLACLLKSPFLGWSEEELFALSYKRKKSLWHELNDFDPSRLQHFAQNNEIQPPTQEKIIETRSWLDALIIKSSLNIFDFYSYVMNHPCPADQISGLRAIISRLGQDALDPLDEFMNAALNFSGTSIDALQLFLDQQEHEEKQIKREMEEAGSQVRIMTVHASKGLQAPIVILPDTIQNAAYRKTSRLLWPDKTQLDVPLWSARKDIEPKEFSAVFTKYKNLQEEEGLRLLYVAMTRAADRLYIAGCEGSRKGDDNSWYHLIRDAMESDDTVQTLENEILRIENLQSANPDKKSRSSAESLAKHNLPDWAYKKAPTVKNPVKTLSPSNLGQESHFENIISPLKGKAEYRFKRGNITHKLLEFLPELPPEERKNAAGFFTEKYSADLPAEIRKNIVIEVMNIIEHPDYAPFFGLNSLAEAPISGYSKDGKHIINAQLDRLVILDKEIWILDYKSNRPPPKKQEDIPQIYKNQIESYKKIIEQIYPDYTINCGLLWTDGPNLMII